MCEKQLAIEKLKVKEQSKKRATSERMMTQKSKRRIKQAKDRWMNKKRSNQQVKKQVKN